MTAQDTTIQQNFLTIFYPWIIQSGYMLIIPLFSGSIHKTGRNTSGNIAYDRTLQNKILSLNERMIIHRLIGGAIHKDKSVQNIIEQNITEQRTTELIFKIDCFTN